MGIVSKEDYAERRKSCLETWIPELPRNILPVFLIGRPIQKVEYAYDHTEHILSFNCGDHYHDIPAKVRGFCRWAINHHDSPYYLKCDDDAYLNGQLVATYPFHRYDYIGCFYEGLTGKAHGAFYSISKRCATALAMATSLDERGYEDNMVNDVLRKAIPDLSVRDEWEPRFALFSFAKGMSPEFIAGHPIRPPSAMYQVHQVVKASW